jgi:polar amino acid transport system substrate-binding protein
MDRKRRTVCAHAAMGAALALLASACSAGLVNVGAHPSPGLPQPGSVSSAKPSAGASSAPADAGCNPQAVSLRPTAADAAGSTVSTIKKRGYLVVGVAADGYLTGYRDASGNETGFDVDIARQVEQALFGTQDAKHIKFVVVDNAERITDLQAGAKNPVDLVADTFTITCARAKQVLFSTVYYEGRQQVLVLKGSGYTSLDQLGGKKVCAQKDSTSIAAIEAYPSHPLGYGVANLTDCLVALQQNQVDAISTDDTILAGLAAQDPNTVVLSQAVESEPYGLAVSLRAPDLIRFVNGVLEDIRGNGVWETIYGRWLHPPLDAAQPPAAQYAG